MHCAISSDADTVQSWDPASASKGIHKTGSWSACPDFIDARYPFTTLLHQGFIERAFIDDMCKHGIDVQRPWKITGFENNGKNADFPLEVTFKHVTTDETERVRANYLFSGEGARSFVREHLGFKIRHKDPVSHVWGVMDGVVRTDFPDVKV